MSSKNELIEQVAQKVSPHLWNGKLEEALSRSAHFTSEQVEKSVQEKRQEARQKVETMLQAAIPLILREIYDGWRREETFSTIDDMAAEFGVDW